MCPSESVSVPFLLRSTGFVLIGEMGLRMAGVEGLMERREGARI